MTRLNGCIFSPSHLSHTLRANSPNTTQNQEASVVPPATLGWALATPRQPEPQQPLQVCAVPAWLTCEGGENEGRASRRRRGRRGGGRKTSEVPEKRASGAPAPSRVCRRGICFVCVLHSHGIPRPGIQGKNAGGDPLVGVFLHSASENRGEVTVALAPT